MDYVGLFTELSLALFKLLKDVSEPVASSVPQ